MGDPTSQRLIRVAGILGSLISLAWLTVAIKTIRDPRILASDWYGITCCDPQDNIVAFYMLAALCLAFLVISYLLAWLKDSPTAALVLVFITFVPMAHVSTQLFRQSAQRNLEVSQSFLLLSCVANLVVVVLVVAGWLHERNHIIPDQSRWEFTKP